MEWFYENKYFPSDEMYREYIRKIICKKTTRYGAIFAAAGAAGCLYSVFAANYVLAAVFGVCAFICLFVLIVAPILTVKQVKQNEQRLHNGARCQTIIRFGQAIEILEGDFQLKISYEQIQKVYALKHSYVLIFGEHNGILLDPHGFTQGSLEEVKHLLRQKCPHVTGI